jgi:hypothetical protein
MKMELKRAACRDALNMASTGRLKKVEYENSEEGRKLRLAALIRDNVKPNVPRTPLEALVQLARIEAERAKAFTDLFALVLSHSDAETIKPAAARPRRRRKRPNNVVALKPRPGGETAS